MIAYRFVETGIRLICITTHKLCFARRDGKIYSATADKVPKTIKRQSLGRQNPSRRLRVSRDIK